MLKICFDLDGVLCKTKSNNYHKSVPIKKNISFVNSLYKNYYIIIFTARFMGRSNDLEKIAIKKGLSLTKNQLKKWGVKYHKLKIVLKKLKMNCFVSFNSLNKEIVSIFQI